MRPLPFARRSHLSLSISPFSSSYQLRSAPLRAHVYFLLSLSLSPLALELQITLAINDEPEACTILPR